MIDAHLHVWDLSRGGHHWVPPGSALDRSFLPGEAVDELARAGVDRAVLVQADDTLDDTAFMLDAATSCDALVGVVGWVRLDSPSAAGEQLARHLEHRALCGVRHLVHDDPRDGFLSPPSVRSSLRAVAAAGLTPADIDVFLPHQANLRIVEAIARQLRRAGARADLRVADDIVSSGNTSSASVPLALDHMRADGRVRPGDVVLMAGFGAGASWAAQVVVAP